MKRPNTVDEYIKNAPKEDQNKLTEIRKIIKDTAPKSVEKISYGMPYYGYKGRLVYFGLAKKHIGLYIPPPVIEEHKDDLKEYKTATSTVQFPLNQELPIAIIEKLVKARIKKNDESEKNKIKK